jgi:hypothetical protein
MSQDPIESARIEFAAAKLRLDRLTEDLGCGVFDHDEIASARDGLLVAERRLAAARGEPHAVPIEFPVLWDTGAPLPHLLKNEHRTFLTFLLPERRSDPEVIEDPSESIAVVEFQRCISAKLGSPNDEVTHGHPLYGRGFEAYLPLRVENSPWIKELEAVNSVHEFYKAEQWRTLQHFIFGFHDSTFECIAESFKLEMRRSALPQTLRELCEKL